MNEKPFVDLIYFSGVPLIDGTLVYGEADLILAEDREQSLDPHPSVDAYLTKIMHEMTDFVHDKALAFTLSIVPLGHGDEREVPCHLVDDWWEINREHPDDDFDDFHGVVYICTEAMRKLFPGVTLQGGETTLYISFLDISIWEGRADPPGYYDEE